MINFIEESTQSMVFIVAIIVAIAVFAIKSTEKIDKRWLPLVSFVIGGVLGGLIGLYFGDTFMGAVDGVIAGGFASGAYDFIVSVFNLGGKKKEWIDHNELDEEFTPPKGEE